MSTKSLNVRETTDQTRSNYEKINKKDHKVKIANNAVEQSFTVQIFIRRTVAFSQQTNHLSCNNTAK